MIASEESSLCLEFSEAYRVAFAVAGGEGLGREDAEDCATECALRVSTNRAGAPDGLSDIDFRRWLCRCAKNLACDYRRRQNRREQHELKFPAWNEPEHNGPSSDPQDEAEDPQIGALRAEFMTRIVSALAVLPDTDRLLLTYYYIAEKSISDIAACQGKQISAVKKALQRSRKRWRKSLCRAGLTSDDARDYLSEVGHSVGNTTRRTL